MVKTIERRLFIVEDKREEENTCHGYLRSNPGVNFINVFTPSFYDCRSQKRKKLLELTAFFVLLGSALVKAARKMLVILTPATAKLSEEEGT